jgi:hypothetical protein
MNHAVGDIIIVVILTAVEPLVLHQQAIQEDAEEFDQLEKRQEEIHLEAAVHKEVDAIPIAIVIRTAIVQEH